MKATKYIDKMKIMQTNLLEYIEKEDNTETNFNNLKLTLDQNVRQNIHDLRSFLHLLIKISNNHHHVPLFFNKIGHIIEYIKEDITKNFTNSDIFNIFKSNKRILLFLIEEKVIIFDNFIAAAILKDKFIKPRYSDYFSPEIKSRLNSKPELPENFEEKRKIGENDSTICEIIRKDSIEEFKSFVEKTNLDLSSKIDFSLFETNSFLNKNQPNLIEYAAFCGSLNIVKYLFSNKTVITPSLWIFAVHSQNLDLIHFLVENHIEPEDKSYEKCFIESIKCHHNEIACYIRDNLYKTDDKNTTVIDTCCYQYYNFEFIQNDSIDESFIYDLCRFSHYSLVYLILCNIEIDINILYIQIFHLSSNY